MMYAGRTRPFHERFDVEVGTKEAKQRFINRVSNFIFGSFVYSPTVQRHGPNQDVMHRLVAVTLGVKYNPYADLDAYVGNDFSRCLQVLEALYDALENTRFQDELSHGIEMAIGMSEVDIGIRWQPPNFVPTGAPMLDEPLVNESLQWLSEPKYQSVRQPFEKGLSHYLEATNKPERLGDVVTDMYEATEALARVVTGKDSELSGNRELFVKKLNVSSHYREMLRNYIRYGNEYRHAVRRGNPRTQLTEPEVEAFIYLTGLFIRLVMRTT